MRRGNWRAVNETSMEIVGVGTKVREMWPGKRDGVRKWKKRKKWNMEAIRDKDPMKIKNAMKHCEG